jgi:hypothetical protein
MLKTRIVSVFQNAWVNEFFFKGKKNEKDENSNDLNFEQKQKNAFIFINLKKMF